MIGVLDYYSIVFFVFYFFKQKKLLRNLRKKAFMFLSKPLRSISTSHFFKSFSPSTLYSNFCTTRQLQTNSSLEKASFFPFGNADFVSIRISKQFYVDKTHYIPLLERAGEQLFFVRPLSSCLNHLNSMI